MIQRRSFIQSAVAAIGAMFGWKAKSAAAEPHVMPYADVGKQDAVCDVRLAELSQQVAVGGKPWRELYDYMERYPSLRRLVFPNWHADVVSDDRWTPYAAAKKNPASQNADLEAGMRMLREHRWNDGAHAPHGCWRTPSQEKS